VGVRLVRAAFVLLVLAGAIACGAAQKRSFETADEVAALLRNTWGSTEGFPSFNYSCMTLDDRGQLFTCLARDHTDTVKLASFDVVCDGSRCRWRVYPSYIG
jgi:hypothetical protein